MREPRRYSALAATRTSYAQSMIASLSSMLSLGAIKPSWPVHYFTMSHMTSSFLVHKRAELEEVSIRSPVADSRKVTKEYLPLYEGKMVQMFDHRAASVVVNLENLNRPAQTAPATEAQHADPIWTPTPQFWIDADKVDWPKGRKWAIGFKDVTAPTNVRTIIAAFVPRTGVDNTLPLIVPDEGKATENYNGHAPLLLANLNSFVFDFIARQKVQGQHLNWFIVEQVPVIPPATYVTRIRRERISDLIRAEVLRLTYTATDMRFFAEDMGYGGEPFRWDEDERRHCQARLNAIYFQLYGLDEEGAGYILDTFPIVRAEDERLFGRYRTKEMILAYMPAFGAGDAVTRVAV